MLQKDSTVDFFKLRGVICFQLINVLKFKTSVFRLQQIYSRSQETFRWNRFETQIESFYLQKFIHAQFNYAKKQLDA